jgi:hypothetical protein
MNNVKKCKYCKTDMNKSEKICPNCKKKQKLPDWSVALIIICCVYTSGLIGLIGLVKGVNETSNLKVNEVSTITPSIEETKKITNTLEPITNSTPQTNTEVSNETKTVTTPVVPEIKKETATVDTNEKIITPPTTPAVNTTPPKVESNKVPVVSDEKTYTVYITKTGEKYHRSGCKYLKKSSIAINSGDAISQGYGPCSVCNP